MQSSQSSVSSRDPSACEVSTDGSLSSRRPSRRQGVWWMATIPHHSFTPYLPPGIRFIRGQLEEGGVTGYLHWQICLCLFRKGSARLLQELLGPCHVELTRSKASLNYVWKKDTAIDGTQFQLGELPVNRSYSNDWDAIWLAATRGDIMGIPADIRIRCYSTLRRIGEDYMEPIGIVRTCFVFWGVSDAGKSRRAWEEAGSNAYPKDPRTKFWCGYRNQENVVIDEFRGGIDVSHLLRWLDRYPCCIEIKGGAKPLLARRFWITSNLPPEQWYPDLDITTRDALLRRMVVTQF